MSPQIDISKEDLVKLLDTGEITISNESSKKIALEFINSHDFPTKKLEEWKYTDIRPILRHKYSLGKKMEIPKHYITAFGIFNENENTLVFINGHFSKENSVIKSELSGFFIGGISEGKAQFKNIFEKNINSSGIFKDNVFSALNTAFATDGALIIVPDNYLVENPVHIMNFSDGEDSKIFNQSKNLIVTGKNSQIEIVNSYHSLSTNFTLNNICTEIILGENSSINYNLFQGEGDEAFHINNTHVIQNKNSRFTSNTATLCGALMRNDLTIDLQDENCETNLYGLYLPDREQHFDNYLFVNHAKPHCISRQVYKGIIDNRAQAVFTGKVLVQKDAQKTDAAQSNKNLLITDYAKAYSRPQLIINADDVSCAHGSTTGQIDKEALFYIQSRGIGEKDARVLMMYAFASEVINKITLPAYRQYLDLLVDKRLKGEKVEGMCSLQLCPGCNYE